MLGVLFPGDRQVALREYDIPEPGPGFALIKMQAAGVCGSDLRFAYQMPSEQRDAEQVAGHEPCGIVASVGPGVSLVEPGDRVVCYHIPNCGVCRYCRMGAGIYCENKHRLHEFGYPEPPHRHVGRSAFVDYHIFHERNLLPLPDDVSYAVGAMSACSAGTAFKALCRLGVSSSDTLAIFGLGPLGLSAVVLGKAMGAQVIGVEPTEARRGLATQMGADTVLDPMDVDAVEALRDLTRGYGPEAVVEFSHSHAGRSAAIESAAKYGRVALIGGGGEHPVPVSRLIQKELTIVGNWVFDLASYHRLMDMVTKQGVDLEQTITHRFRLEQAAEAMALADSGQVGRIIFEWDD